MISFPLGSPRHSIRFTINRLTIQKFRDIMKNNASDQADFHHDFYFKKFAKQCHSNNITTENEQTSCESKMMK